MAYTAVAYLKQLMEGEILPFLQRALIAKQSNIMDFYVKARDNLVYCSNKFLIFDDPSLSQYSYRIKLEERWFGGRVWEGLLTDIDSTVNDLNSVNSRLKEFVHELDSGAISQPLSTLSQQREFANDMLSFNLEMEEVLTSYNQAANSSISLLQRVNTFLEESKNADVVKVFKFAADIGTNSIQDLNDRHILDDHEKIHLICDLLKHVNNLLDDRLPSENLEDGSCMVEEGSSSQRERVHDLGTNHLESVGANLSRTPEARQFFHENVEDIVVGLDVYLGGIIDELTRPPVGLTVVTIVGMGGIGKTTLAKKVFHHPCIGRYFHCLAWVNVGSNVQQVLSDLVYDIRPPSDEIMDDKGESLRKCLKGRRYLIIVDGLWDFEAWDTIKNFFPDDKLGSRILITSRVMEFPTSSGTDVPKKPRHCYDMRPLNEAESWELLEKKLFGNQRCPIELEEVGRQISEKCGGLPLAIVLIAGTLLNLPMSYISWLSVLVNIPAIVWANPESCLDIVALSYNYLSHHLKPCFLLMGAFPSNYEIRFERLIRLWLADGFFFDRNRDHAEKEAENCLKELIRRSLVSVSKISLDGKIKTCLVHDIVRQLCLREAQNEKFMHVTEGNSSANATGLEEQRHLVFIVDDCAKVAMLPPIRHLRSYTWLTMGCDFTPGIVLLHLSSLKWLRVLDVYILPFGTFPPQIADLLNLRYLALNVTEVMELGRLIYNLRKLQTLVVYGPWIPAEFEGNPTLQLKLCLSHANFMVPVCLSSRTSGMVCSLRSLSFITFSSPILFSRLDKLKKLGISETKPDYEQNAASECFRSWSCMEKLMEMLEILKCCFYRGNKDARNLCLRDFPRNLKKLTLRWPCSSWKEMVHLAELRNLETLKLKNNAMGGLKWVLTEEVVFPALKQLLIDRSDLVYWETESKEHFPRLEHLVLRYCTSLVEIPPGVGELSVLESIELHSCSKSAVDSARAFEELYESPKVFIRTASARMGIRCE